MIEHIFANTNLGSYEEFYQISDWDWVETLQCNPKKMALDIAIRLKYSSRILGNTSFLFKGISQSQLGVINAIIPLIKQTSLSINKKLEHSKTQIKSSKRQVNYLKKLVKNEFDNIANVLTIDNDFMLSHTWGTIACYKDFQAYLWRLTSICFVDVYFSIESFCKDALQVSEHHKSLKFYVDTIKKDSAYSVANLVRDSITHEGGYIRKKIKKFPNHFFIAHDNESATNFVKNKIENSDRRFLVTKDHIYPMPEDCKMLYIDLLPKIVDLIKYYDSLE